ncbi:MAG TPA: glycosyl transferase [Bacteroidales bacterium]|jgi:glucosyl-3-phosphoglycerate synthase|nr:glycosyl transferase [Bacteroidales bacterium]
MGDFYQNGVVTTLHNLRSLPYQELEKRLIRFSKKRPISLILPSLYSELEGPALSNIVDELIKVPYLEEIIIGLDKANKEEFKKAKSYFARLPQHHRILWNDGPRLQALDKMLVERNIAPSEMGKGRNAWFCFGYFNASGRSEAVALHDCDIVTYDRSMLARLLYPVVDPTFNYKFCKGYYFRSDDKKLNGRVARLLITPLIRTLKKFFGNDPFLEYLDSFRYPLAGEFSMRADVTKTIRIPSDWSLEIGILSEAVRNNALGRICQVDIADRYDHKHQTLSEGNPGSGLSKMSIEISKAIFAKLSTQGAVFSKGLIRSIKAAYYRIALDFLDQFQADAVINGLTLDRHAEEEAIDVFAANVYHAGLMFLDNPMMVPTIPSWKRVISAIPDFYERLNEAVEMDNA